MSRELVGECNWARARVSVYAHAFGMPPELPGGSQRSLACPLAFAAREGAAAAVDDIPEDDGRSIVLALQDESELTGACRRCLPPPLAA